MDEIILANPVIDDQAPAPPAQRLILSTGFDILKAKYEPVIQILPDILPAGLGIFAGMAKKGKTTFIFQGSQAICTPGGGMFLNQKIEPGKVLYLSLEEWPEAIQERMIDQSWTDEQAKNITFVTLDQFRKLFGFLHIPGAAGKLCEYVSSNQFRLVVIDTFAKAFLGLRDQDKSEVITQALTPLQQLSNTLNFASLLIDHHGHARGFDPDPVNDVMSSSAKSQIADTIIGLYSDGQGKKTLKIVGRRIPEHTISLVWDGLTRCYQRPEDDISESELTGNRLKIRRWLRGHGPANLTEISEGTGIAKGNLSPLLKQLVQGEYVIYDEVSRFYVACKS